MIDHSEQAQPLSPVGERRRETILGDAVRLGRRRRRTRHFIRVSLALFPIAVAIAFASLHSPQPATVTERVPPATSPTTRAAMPDGLLLASTPTVRIERIEDDRTIVARYATDDAPAKITRIDDRQLFQALADANLRGGLATIGGHTRLVLSR